MAEGLLDSFAGALNPLLTRASGGMFGGGDEIRWEGLTNAELAVAIQQLKSGPGASAMTQAADALATIATNLASLDQTLRDQLQAIGVNWQSDAGDLAQEMTGAAAAYGGTAGRSASTSSAAVAATAGAYAAAKNTAPDVAALAGPPAATFAGSAGGSGGMTGHADDRAKQAAAAAAARQRAIDTMRDYTSSTQAGLSSHQSLPPAPTIGLTPASGAPAPGPVTTVSDFIPPPPGVHGTGGTPGLPGNGGTPGTGGGGGGGFQDSGPTAPGVGLPGGAGVPAGGSSGGSAGGVPTAGGLPGFPGGGGGGRVGLPGIGGPGAGSVGGAPPAPLGPAPFSGTGEPNPAGPAGGIAATAAVESGGVSGALIEDAALGTAILGGAAGAGIGGASARKDRLVRGRDLVEEVGPVESDDDDRYGARQQAARALAELEGEEAREAESSAMRARLAGIDAAPAALLEPVRRDPDDDQRHRNRYGVEEDMFGDPRMVVPPVLDGRGDRYGQGDDPAESK